MAVCYQVLRASNIPCVHLIACSDILNRCGELVSAVRNRNIFRTAVMLAISRDLLILLAVYGIRREFTVLT